MRKGSNVAAMFVRAGGYATAGVSNQSRCPVLCATIFSRYAAHVVSIKFATHGRNMSLLNRAGSHHQYVLDDTCPTLDMGKIFVLRAI